jgi:hypothetical protein
MERPHALWRLLFATIRVSMRSRVVTTAAMIDHSATARAVQRFADPQGTAIRVPARRRVVIAAVAFVAAAGLLSARALSKLNAPGAPDGTEWAMSDFRDAVYYPERAFLDGKDPYDHATLRTYPIGNGFPVYSPITFVVHLPFGLLPYRAAELAYFVTALALTIVLAWLALVMSGVEADAARVLGVASVLLLSRPGHQNLLLGQTTLQIVIGAYVAMQWARTRPWLASAGLVLCSIKPNWIAPFALLMLFRREARPVLLGGALAAVGAAVGLVVLAMTPGALAGVLESARQNFLGWNVSRIVLPSSSWIRVDAWALFGRLAGNDLSLIAKIVTSATILVLSAIALLRLSSGANATKRHVALAITCLATLLCVHHQSYDLLFLAAPITGLALAADALPAALRRYRVALLVLLAIPLANYVAAYSTLATFDITGPAWTIATSVNAAVMLAAWAVYVMLAFHPVMTVER